MLPTKRALIAAFAGLACAATASGAAQVPEAAQTTVQHGHWSSTEIVTLKRWVASAPHDALPVISTTQLDEAIASQQLELIAERARTVALRLARMHLLGNATSTERAGWNIVDTDAELAIEPMLERAVADGTLDTFFALMRPSHQEYSALRSAYEKEADAVRRMAIARNMERWRWMPKSLGEDYVLVNAAGFEASLWRGGQIVQKWKVIVGKRSTPTPVFNTKIEGVVLNPWWEIPSSIVRESVGALVRRNPTLARERGYVWGNGRYRQKPGPGNALGLMKLVMPNRYSVYMHDTPNKQLFDEDFRSFSHGCIRTNDAIGFAARLLEGQISREEVDAVLASGKTVTIDLARHIPIYVAYFTAVSDGEGTVTMLSDIYDRDKRIRLTALGRSLRAGSRPIQTEPDQRNKFATCALTDSLSAIG